MQEFNFRPTPEASHSLLYTSTRFVSSSDNPNMQEHLDSANNNVFKITYSPAQTLCHEGI